MLSFIVNHFILQISVIYDKKIEIKKHTKVSMNIFYTLTLSFVYFKLGLFSNDNWTQVIAQVKKKKVPMSSLKKIHQTQHCI